MRSLTIRVTVRSEVFCSFDCACAMVGAVWDGCHQSWRLNALVRRVLCMHLPSR